MLAAIRNPHVDIIAHPTGRLLGRREGADLELESIFRAAAEMGTALEVNAHPSRLDLYDVLARRAIELGVKLAISSDAHDVSDFGVLPFGVATARRGWVTGGDVLNTHSVQEVMAWTARREARSSAYV
jgi:DNA polymerase (family 10)